MADPREKEFQADIVAALEAGGWLAGEAANYHRERALSPEDALAFVQQAHPDAWQKSARHYPCETRDAINLDASRGTAGAL